MPHNLDTGPCCVTGISQLCVAGLVLFVEVMNKGADARVNLPLPTFAIEYAVVPRARLKMMLFAIRGELAA